MSDRLQTPYRPAALLHLQIRLEEFETSAGSDIPSEALPAPKTLQSLSKQLKPLRAQAASEKAAGKSPDPKVLRQITELQRAQKKLKTQEAVARPSTETPGDAYSIDIWLPPLEVNVEMNSPLIADKAEASFAFRDCPLMSELIRAALLEVYMGTVPAETFADPSRWRLPDDRRQIMFRGYVDTWETDHSGEDAVVQISARSLEAVLIDAKINPLSNTFQIRNDKKVGASKGEPLVDYINRILEGVPATSGKFGGDPLRAQLFGVDRVVQTSSGAVKTPPFDDVLRLDRRSLNRTLQTAKTTNKAQNPTSDQPEVEAEQADPNATDPANLPGAGQPRMPAQVPQGMSAWDLIVQACRLCNLVPMYDPSIDPSRGAPLGLFDEGPTEPRPGDVILLRPPNTLYEAESGDDYVQGGAIDGFSRDIQFRGDQSKKPRQIRFLVWGRNLKSVKTSRKLGRLKSPLIEVISNNTDAAPGKRRLSVVVGKRKDGSRIGAKGEGKANEVVVVNVSGVRDKAQLEQVAWGIYNSMGRQEMSVSIETDDLSSYQDPTDPENNNMNPDVLRLRAGSPVRVIVAKQTRDSASPLVTPLSDAFRMTSVEMQNFLRDQSQRFTILSPNPEAGEKFRKGVAAAIDRRRWTDVFFVRSIKHKFTFDDDGGWSADMELVNFVESRSLARNISQNLKDVAEARTLNKRERKRLKSPKQRGTENANRPGVNR